MKSKLGTYAWAAGTMAAALVVTIFVASKQAAYVAEHNIGSPNISAPPVLLYFFGVVAVMTLVLVFIPLDKLKLVFRIIFTLMYGWGFLVAGTLVFGEVTAWILAVLAAAGWFFFPRVWLHNIVLLVTLCGAGSVFGFVIASPWAFMIVMLVVAVYDLLAVRFGLMIWIADKFSETTALPAFIFPKALRDWAMKLAAIQVGEMKEQAPQEREYSILGGGDIGFPLMLSVAVYFELGTGAFWLVGLCGLLGLMLAYVIQTVWLKEKPMPALPPIAAMCLIGWLIAQAAFS